MAKASSVQVSPVQGRPRSVYIDDALWDALDRLVATERRSKSNIVCVALDEYIRNRETDKKAS